MIDRPPRSSGSPEASIELKVREVGQLFHTLDPLPFRERDLDADVEEYVIGWARELPAHARLRIVIHLPQAEARREEAAHVADAIANYFAYRAQAVGLELKELFRIGRTSMAIGLCVLAVCIVSGRLAAGVFQGDVGGFLAEGLIILGWVANWRPIQIFLYDWWPLARRQRLLRRLAVAPVELSPIPA